jgi:hypothetical protein
MQAVSYALPSEPREHSLFWGSLTALLVGALLGALAVLPYEQLTGLPESACATMRSLIEVVVLGSLCISPPASFVIDVDCMVTHSAEAHVAGQ